MMMCACGKVFEVVFEIQYICIWNTMKKIVFVFVIVFEWIKSICINYFVFEIHFFVFDPKSDVCIRVHVSSYNDMYMHVCTIALCTYLLSIKYNNTILKRLINLAAYSQFSIL